MPSIAGWGRARTGVWCLALAATLANMVHLVANSKALGVDWQTPGGTLLDFRDIVVVPGRYLLHGGNPYDPVPYLAHYPWAQEFDPYSPAWLLVSASLGWMPLHLAASIYVLAMSGASLVFAALLSRWALGDDAFRLTPWLFLWFQVWFPVHSLGSSVLATTGLLLAMVHLDDSHRRGRLLGALGFSLAMLKPQFVLVAIVLMLVRGRWRRVLDGVALGLCGAAIPLLACIRASHGVIGFVQAVQRDVNQASSTAAPTGAVGSDSIRVDLLGWLARFSIDHGPCELLVAGLTVLLLAGIAFIVATRRVSLEDFCVLVVTLTYLAPVHLSYDIVLMAPAGPCAIRAPRRGSGTSMSRASVASWWWTTRLVIALLPVVRLPRLTQLLGLGTRTGDLLDTTAVLLTLVLTVWAILSPPAARSDQLPAPARPAP